MPLRVAEKPGRSGDGEATEVLVAVGAGEFEREGAVGAGGGFGDAACEAGVEGARRAGTWGHRRA